MDAQSDALARVMGLTNRERMLVLASLCGRHPELVTAASATMRPRAHDPG